MLERRTEPRMHLHVPGKISVDEHQTLPCMVFDRSTAGVRVALPNAELVPDHFVLTVVGTGEVLICRSAWRKVDEIGCTTDAPKNGRAVRPFTRRQPVS